MVAQTFLIITSKSSNCLDKLPFVYSRQFPKLVHVKYKRRLPVINGVFVVCGFPFFQYKCALFIGGSEKRLRVHCILSSFSLYSEFSIKSPSPNKKVVLSNESNNNVAMNCFLPYTLLCKICLTGAPRNFNINILGVFMQH